MGNDYTRAVEDIDDAINAAEAIDCVDMDIEGKVADALNRLAEAKALAEARA
jgi:hypothetical protein